MTNKEIINELCVALINRGCERVQNGEAVALDSYMRAALDAADALESILRGRWTPVTERMPEEKHIVLAAVDMYNDPHNCVDALLWVDNGEWTDGYRLVDSVLAWMPLPEAYGGTENE